MLVLPLAFSYTPQVKAHYFDSQVQINCSFEIHIPSLKLNTHMSH